MPGIHTLPCAKWVCRSWCGQKNPSHVAAITLGLRRLEDALLSCSCLLEWKRSSIFKVLGRGVRKLVGAPELLYECQVISIELAESTGEEAFPVLCFVSVQWKNKPSVPLVVNPELFTRTNIWSSTVDGRTIKSANNSCTNIASGPLHHLPTSFSHPIYRGYSDRHDV